jgi:hypothetical protein
MRKLAPVFIAASVFAVSGSAFALGDKRDNKQAPNAATTSTQSSTSDRANYGTSGSMSSSNAMGASSGTGAAPKNATGATDATTLGSSMGSSGVTAGTSGTAMGASGATSATVGNGSSATTMGDHTADKSKKSKAAAAGNDATRCDASKYASRTEMPKDCLDGRKGGAAVGSTQGQSGK